MPQNEPARLAALKEYYIVDTAAEKVFDDIAALAAFICDVSVAGLSLVEQAGQWFKARVGISQEETPRCLAFCAYAILQPEPLIVEDACADARFAGSAQGAEEPRIRFFAGFPLVSRDGFPMGALCAADRRPRRLTDVQQSAMRSLAREAMALLELRRLCGVAAAALENLTLSEGPRLICSLCGKIGDGVGNWLDWEAFLRLRSMGNLNPVICPHCFGTKAPRPSGTKK